MPETQKMFREQSVRKMVSPDKLDDYIHVTNPSVWLILGAVGVLLICAFVWSVEGSIPTTLTKLFTADGGELVSYLSTDEASLVKIGMTVDVDGTSGTISAVGTTPLSYEEAAAQLPGDYAAHVMELSQWNIPVTVSSAKEIADGAFVDVSIVTESVRPIDFLIN
jgi:hypothetical protein